MNQVKTPIYFDYAATTPMDSRVAEKMIPYLCEHFGNPASTGHAFGWVAEEAVENARAEIAHLLNAEAKEIIFTSGATESNNLAIKGAAHYYQTKGKHLITVKTEHQAVLDTMNILEQEGFEVTYLNVHTNGLIDLNLLQSAIRTDTILISVMWVNNEIGVIQDVSKIGEICREKGIIFHVDAAQATGKVIIDLQTTKIDLLSISAHKMYGPKGIGALYVRRNPRVYLKAQIHGGGHERGFRSGTLATHQIVGMGEAYRLSRLEIHDEINNIKRLRDHFLHGLQDIKDIAINGDLEHRIVHNLNVSFKSVEGESLLAAVKTLALSNGSACNSAKSAPSHVLRALGVDDEFAYRSLRITFGRFTTLAEVDYAIKLLKVKVAELRFNSLNPPFFDQHAR